MGDQMTKEQYEYILSIQNDCLERTNMTIDDAWKFAFRCLQLGYKQIIPCHECVAPKGCICVVNKNDTKLSKKYSFCEYGMPNNFY